MQNFNVRYHDGKSAIVNDATLTLMPDHWLIRFTGPNGESRTVRWEINRIVTEQGFTNLCIFRYHDFSEQTVECKEEKLPQILREKYPGTTFFKKKVSNTILKSPLTLVGFFVLLIGLLVGIYFIILPFAAEKIAARIPRSMEIKLGETLYQNVISGYKKNELLSQKVNHFAKAIDFQTTYPIRISVVNKKEINAFALPGGHIVVFDEIIKKMKTKEELAALLAHEVSHVHYQHSLKSIFRSMGGYLFISLLFSDVSAIVAMVAENSNMLLNLTYSRALETEADMNAGKIFKAQGIGMKGLVDLFKVLQTGGQEETNRLLSTHPLTDERMRNAMALAREQTDIRDQSELQNRWIELKATK
ncbi:Beta-barrel assembly-enhancing protease [Dyadobacter sp. CECT 9623]|uniref:Beta-barrel assembly-enhancing protease n=1 Tax=Dyadobacter linearis TaxID=2823330 RepID=A0ABM8UR69_9BACT|nr:M48 family metallopeptidase [Dyadobacter sp. CECT 9623]CAG5069993.1 Beta-barrel assembly-enhancing protease [Dyadobacter sp. CECT 9623]